MKKNLFAMLSLATAISLNAVVLATVDGENITDVDLLGARASELKNIPDDAKRKLIDNAIAGKLLIKEAKASGIEKDQEYKRAVELAKDTIAVNAWEKKQFDAIKIDDSKAKDFYEKNKAKLFTVEPQTRAKHILVQNQKEAEEIIKTLKPLKGKDLDAKFSELAKSKSIDKGSATNGGELGWFGKSQMVPEFANAAFALKTGEISSTPVKSNFGYHVILKQDARSQTVASYDKVKDQIIMGLKQEELGKSLQKKVETLRAKAKIEYK